MRRQTKTKTYQNYKKYIYVGMFLLVVGLVAFSASVNMYSGIVKNDNSNVSSTQEALDTETSKETTSITSKTVEEKEAEERQTQNIEKIKQQEEALNQINTNKEKSNTNTVSKVSTEETKNEKSNSTEYQASKKETTQSQNSENNEQQKEPTFIMPVFGEISREFTKDNLVYSETLDEWITHLGIDILAEKSASVRASSDGTVKSIKNDPRYGLTIIIEHSNGFKTVYANLEDTADIKEGTTVKQGQAIGSVGNSASFESLDAYHLHFEILKDDVAQNPNDYIK